MMRPGSLATKSAGPPATVDDEPAELATKSAASVTSGDDEPAELATVRRSACDCGRSGGDRQPSTTRSYWPSSVRLRRLRQARVPPRPVTSTSMMRPGSLRRRWPALDNQVLLAVVSASAGPARRRKPVQQFAEFPLRKNSRVGVDQVRDFSQSGSHGATRAPFCAPISLSSP